jgi:predicted AlkP superfamily phosphohydrolase/phosphomutase
MKRIKRRFGDDPMPLEQSGVMSVDDLMAIRDQLIGVTATQTRLAEDLIETEAWDLFLMVYGTAHRAGHCLWSDTGAAGGVPAGRRAEFDRALLNVYAACDTGLGRILTHVDETTAVIVFACHGMTDNRSLVDLLPEMVHRIVHEEDGTHRANGPASPGLTQRLRTLLPLTWRSAVKNHLPQSWQDALTLAWRLDGVDWAHTPVFCTMPDLQGHIRVNLAGRERDGIVRPGEEYEFWLEKVTEGLKTFVDESTGQPIVQAVRRPSEMYPDGKMKHFLPDLTVEWPPRVAAQFRAMTSPRYGRIDSPFGGRAPEGRPGHHDFDGWLIAAGPGIEAGASIEGSHELDLAPTLHAWFGLDIPPHFRGRPVAALLGPGAVRPA